MFLFPVERMPVHPRSLPCSCRYHLYSWVERSDYDEVPCSATARPEFEPLALDHSVYGWLGPDTSHEITKLQLLIFTFFILTCRGSWGRGSSRMKVPAEMTTAGWAVWRSSTRWRTGCGSPCWTYRAVRHCKEKREISNKFTKLLK